MQLLSLYIAFPHRPLSRRKILEDRKYAKIKELLPVSAKLDCIVEITVFRNQAKLQPASSADCPLARIIVDVFSTYTNPHFLGLELSFLSQISKVDHCLRVGLFRNTHEATRLFHNAVPFLLALCHLPLLLRSPRLRQITATRVYVI